jgi:prevent-host-death family protein
LIHRGLGQPRIFRVDGQMNRETRRDRIGTLADKTISGHDEAMKKAMVSDLKANLSAYLAEVRRGRSVIVCDRTIPIARLVPYEPDDDEGFQVIPASLPLRDLKKVRSVRPHRTIDDAVRLLREDRDAR